MVVESGEATPNEGTETPAAGAAEGASETASSEAPDGGEPAGQGGAVVPPPYQPTLTFRTKDPVTGRQVEKKFDDWLHPVVKDAETEKKLREMHERSYGLDAVKADRERISQDNQRLNKVVQEWQPTIETVQQIVHFRDQRNLPAVFELLGLDRREVFSWAYQYAQMTPEARQAMESQSRTSMDAYGAQHQMTQSQQQAIQQAQEFKNRELGLILQYDQQVTAAATEFDQQHGQGAFFEQVKRTGEYYWRMGQDIPVQQAVSEVMKLIGRAMPAQPQAHMQQTQVPGQGAGLQQEQQAVPQAPAKKPVIPSVQGTGSSPVKRVYRSMDDLRKRRKELEAEDMVG